jgi:hypothetical protein
MSGRMCNYCLLHSIRRRNRGKRIVLTPGRFTELGNGVDVLVGPKRYREATIKAHRDRYFVAWFMSISEECVC